MPAALATRTHVKPRQRILAVNAPKDYAALLGELPDDTSSALRFESVADVGRRGGRRS
jgi:hypothetical protein